MHFPTGEPVLTRLSIGFRGKILSGIGNRVNQGFMCLMQSKNKNVDALKIREDRILKIRKLNSSRDLHVIDGIAVFISWTENF